ncbi:MAG: ABC transporter permease [Anaerovoracaceae bacterium]
MVKVDSKNTIFQLAKEFNKANRGRNIIAIIAIVLTTVLFTSVFAGSFSILKSTMESEFRRAMDSSHISVKNLTKEQFDRVSAYDGIKEMGYVIMLSSGENQKLSEINTEIRAADTNGAKGFNCLPTTGTLPQKENELATSSIVLNALGVKEKLGEKVTMEYKVKGEKVTKTFVLTGFWQGDPLGLAQEIYVSEKYCKSVMSTATEKDIINGKLEGCYDISIWCDNQFGLEKKANAINEKYGLLNTGAKAVSNIAYDIFNEDGFPFGMVFGILLIVIMAGYLIIYNVFNISVNNDIRAYGLLKNIGTTGKQLKKIVRMQALYLSIIGVPLGMLGGYLLGNAMTPYLLSNLENTNPDVVFTSSNPIIFIASALISILTVYAGCIKPCKLVEKISPVEAIRMTESYGNTRRNWAKIMAVVISLALSLMVANGVYSIVKGFDKESYLNSFVASDFRVTGTGSSLITSNLNAIEPDLGKKVSMNPNVTSYGLFYFTSGKHILDDVGLNNIKQMAKAGIEAGIFREQSKETIENVIETKQMVSHIMGINRGAFEKLELEDKCTWEEFQSGDYVITEPSNHGLCNYYNPKDTVSIDFGKGKTKEYTVIANAYIAYQLEYNFYDSPIYQTFFVPEKDYIAMTGNDVAMHMSVEVKDGKEKEFNSWLGETINKSGEKLYVTSVIEVAEACENYINKFYLIGGILGAVLFIIGVMNFFNTSAVSIFARRKELSLLEAIGMTKKQIVIKLIKEGLTYIAGATIIATTVGLVISSIIVKKLVGMIFFFSLHPTIIPTLWSLPLLILVAILVPVYNYRKMCKETVVERLNCY